MNVACRKRAAPRSRRSLIAVSALTIVVLVLGVASPAHAYIGPGAGFAIASSLFVIIWTMFLAFLTLLLWPIRYVIRAFKGRRAFAKSRIKRLVILGLDGMAVHRRQLVFPRDHDLFGIEHAAALREVVRIAVARGEEKQAGGGEIAAAIIGHLRAALQEIETVSEELAEPEAIEP